MKYSILVLPVLLAFSLATGAVAAPSAITFRLDSGTAKPTEPVELHLSIRADEAFQGFEFSIDFDEELLVADDAFTLLDGFTHEFEAYQINNTNDAPGGGGVDEGFIGGQVVVSSSADVLPANEDVDVVGLRLSVRDGAPEGTTELSFVDGAEGFGHTFENAVTAGGVRVTSGTASSFQTLGGSVEILAVGPLYIRGDANSDGVVSIADAHFIDGYLFLGWSVPPCFASADVDSNGVVNITDSVYVFRFLFQGAPSPAAPFPEPGFSSDDDCESSGGGSPLEDPGARLQIVDSIADTASEPIFPLKILISNSTPIAGFTLTVASDSPIFQDVAWRWFEDELDGERLSFENLEVSDDRFQHAVLFALTMPTNLPPGDSRGLDYIVCPKDGVAAGDYPLTIEDAEFVDLESGRAIYPAVEGGTLTFPEDTAVGDCGGDLDRPRHEFRLGDTSGGPGDVVCVPFSIRTAEDKPTMGYAYSVDFDETVLEALGTVEVFQRPLTVERGFEIFEFDNSDENPGSGGVDEGFFIGAYVISLTGPERIPTDLEAVEVVRLVARIRDDAEAGGSNMRFVNGGAVSGEPVYNQLTIDGVSHDPWLVNGSVTILDAPIGDADCEANLPDPPETPINILFQLDDASGGAGQVVGVPFLIRADRPSQGFEFSADFDEGVLETVDIVQRWRRPDGTSFDFVNLEFSNDDRVPGSHGVDEGYLVGAAIISVTDTADVLPPEENVEVLRFVMRIAEDAQPGSTEIRFEDGAIGSGGEPVDNKLIAGGARVTPALADSFVFIDAVVTILPDGVLFLRGDSNDDGLVNISDARFTLDFLFVGGELPECADAADANDDGRLDISDAVATLEYLFLGTTELPPPISGPGADPTPDGLRCGNDL